MFILTGERRLSQALKERLVLGESFKSKIPRPVVATSGKMLSQEDKNNYNDGKTNSYYNNNSSNSIHNTDNNNNTLYNNIYNTQYSIDFYNNNNNNSGYIDYYSSNNNNNYKNTSCDKDTHNQATDLNNNNNDNDFQTVTAYSDLKKFQDQQQHPQQRQHQQLPQQQKRQLQAERIVATTANAPEKSRIPLRDASFNSKNSINNDANINNNKNNNNTTIGSVSNTENPVNNRTTTTRIPTTTTTGGRRKTIMRGGGVGTLKGGDSINASRRRPFFNVRFDDVTTTEKNSVTSRSSLRRSRKVKTTKGSAVTINDSKATTSGSSNSVFKHAARFKSSLPYYGERKVKKTTEVGGGSGGSSLMVTTKKSKSDNNTNSNDGYGDNNIDNSKSKFSRKFTTKVIFGAVLLFFCFFCSLFFLTVSYTINAGCIRSINFFLGESKCFKISPVDLFLLLLLKSLSL